MIDNEDPTFRITVIILNAVSITASIFLLVLICRIKQLHERQGHTIQIVLILECIYSFFLLLSQFYYDQKDEFASTFLVDSTGPACIIIGIFSVSTSFAYFSAINCYSLESLGYLSSKITTNYRLRHLAIVGGSVFFGLLAFLSKAVGFNKIGICSLEASTVFTWFLLILTLVTFIIIVWTCFQILRFKKALGTDLTSRIQNSIYKVNIVYIITFLVIRIIPVLILTIISLAESDAETYSAAFYTLAIPMSLGGLFLSFIRSQEPTISDFLSRKLYRQNTGNVELSVPKVDITTQSFDSQSNDSIIIKTHYLSYLQPTRDNSVAYRKTCLENEEFVTKLISQIENNQTKLKLDEFGRVFKIIVMMNEQIPPSSVKILGAVTPYQMKYMRQKTLYINSQSEELQAEEVICTTYGEAVFDKILPLQSFITSFDEKSNYQFLEQLVATRGRTTANQLTTFDGEVLVQLISKDAKVYIKRCLIEAHYLLSQSGQKSFLPPLMALYSVVHENNQYTLLVAKNLLNTIMIESKNFKIIGLFTYQVGQVDAQIKGGGHDIYSKIKMSQKVKQEFISVLNNDLTILRSQYLWGYSFYILYLEHEETNISIPNLFRTKNGYIMASVGGIVDQFWIECDESFANPELYASQLAQQIDLLV